MELFDDQIMDGYLKILNSNFSSGKIFASSPYLVTLALRNINMKEEKEKEHMRRLCKSLRASVRLETLSKWVIVINDDNIHWKLAVVMIQNRTILFYDSLSLGPASDHM